MIFLQEIETMESSFDEPVYRNNVMAGLLVTRKQEQIKNININTNFICRKMLFHINDEGLAMDLLYDSPYYQVEGYENESNEEINQDFIITNPIDLSTLLVYNKFKAVLNSKDIKKIYSMFLRKNKKDYYLENCKKFGYQIEKETVLKLRNGKVTTSTATYIEKTDKIHPIDSNCFNIINIIDNTRKPSPLEQENGKIKTKILTLFD